MPATMHLALNPRLVWKVICFLQIKGVHVGTQTDSSAVVRSLPFQGPNNPSDTQSTVDLVAEFCELFGDEVRLQNLFDGGFRMRMQSTAPSRHISVEFSNTINNRHHGLPLRD